MACLSPGSALTDEERECCRQMADSDPYLSNSRIAISAHADATLAILPISKIIGLPDDISGFAAASDAHAPPELPPAKISILRI